MSLNAAGVALHRLRFHAPMEFPAVGEMAERVDVRAHMTAERDGIRARTGAAIRHHVAMFLGQAEQERWMGRKVRHAHEIWLREVVNFGSPELIEQIYHRRRA